MSKPSVKPVVEPVVEPAVVIVPQTTPKVEDVKSTMTIGTGDNLQTFNKDLGWKTMQAAYYLAARPVDSLDVRKYYQPMIDYITAVVTAASTPEEPCTVDDLDLSQPCVGQHREASWVTTVDYLYRKALVVSQLDAIIKTAPDPAGCKVTIAGTTKTEGTEETKPLPAVTVTFARKPAAEPTAA